MNIMPNKVPPNHQTSKYFEDWYDLQCSANDILDPNEEDYYKLEKEMEAKIVFLDLQGYLELCALSRGKPASSWRAEYRSINVENAKAIAQLMLKGKKFRPIHVGVFKRVKHLIGQEGRHRAFALIQLMGYDTVPVVMITDWTGKSKIRDLGLTEGYAFSNYNLYYRRKRVKSYFGTRSIKQIAKDFKENFANRNPFIEEV